MTHTKGNVGAFTAADAAGHPKPGEPTPPPAAKPGEAPHHGVGDHPPVTEHNPASTPGGQKPTGTPGQTTGNH